eukprot:scpid57877/ scgid0114/ Eukaryotic translation initiation factor 2 subunit 2; Eukaryotic translation initiation factor 2 subunit beta
MVTERKYVIMYKKEDCATKAAAAAAAADDVTDDLGAFNPSMKKKKKKKKAAPEFDALAGAESGDVLVDDATSGAADEAEASADHDYTYQELLDRVFEIMRAKDPGGGIGERPKFVLKPPQVTRIGTRKTSFVNFTEICKLLHRQPKHLLAFICAELGTSGSVDANNQLIIRGRYQQKQIESVLRRYIKEYVTCHTCRSPETILQKETRLFFLQCERCNSRCSVATIKSGFQAVTQKRAAQRAKQQ